MYRCLKTFARTSMISGAAAMIWMAPALGQSTTPPAAGAGSPVLRLEAIAVTATKTEKSSFDVPASVTVIDREQMDRDQVRNLGDILKNLPGVDMDGGPRAIAEQPNIRGLGTTRIVMTIDGARQNFEAGHRGRVFLDPDLLNQVEVVRGPQSALHGSGALGGVIAMTTKDAADLLRPGEQFGAMAKLGYQTASIDRLASTSLFGRAGNFDALISGLVRDNRDISLGNGAHLSQSNRDIESGLAKIGTVLADHHSFKLSAQTFTDKAGVPANPSVAASQDSPNQDRSTQQDTYTLNYNFRDPANDWLRVHGVAYNTRTAVRERRYSDNRRDNTNFDTVGFDARNTSTLWRGSNAQNEITFGADWFKDEQNGTRNGAPRTQFPSAEARLLGLYLQDEITLFKDWSLIAGLRWDSWVSESSVSEQNRHHTSPKISSVWRAMPWLSLYATYAEGFRAPTLTELFISGQHFPGSTFVATPDLRPETASNREGSFRLKFDEVLRPKDALRVKFSYYDMSVTDFIDTVIGIPTSRNVNVPSAHLYGFEGEMGYDADFAFASIGLSRVRGTNETENKPLASIPQDKVLFGLGGRLRQYDLTIGWRGILAAAQDRVPIGTALNTASPVTGGSFVQDIYLSWCPTQGILQDNKVDIGVDNLFDRAYRRHLANFVEEGRNLKLTLSRQF